jgi:hypothetical protein
MKTYDVLKQEADSAYESARSNTSNPHSALEQAIAAADTYFRLSMNPDTKKAMELVGKIAVELGEQDALWLFTSDSNPPEYGDEFEAYIRKNCGNYRKYREIGEAKNSRKERDAYFYITASIEIKTAVMKSFGLLRRK